MSSILTNTGAMTALATLRSTNSNLLRTQEEISTGKSVATAKDNAAIWAISKVVESDVKGFEAISDSLGFGGETVAVARQAAEAVTKTLQDMKGKIVAAQRGSADDRAKIQTDIDALKGQIGSIVSAAQINGTNLVDGSVASIDLLSSLDRSAGGVATSSITVASQDLSSAGYTAKAAFTGSDGVSAAADTAAFTLDSATGTGTLAIDPTAALFAEGDRVSVRIGDKVASYTVTAEDLAAATTTADMVAVGLKNSIDALGIADLTVDYDSGTPGSLAFTNAGARDLAVSATFANAGSGTLAALDGLDVQSDATAEAALTNVETMIQASINAAAALGSAQGRIEIQSEFISGLTDSLKAGIGALVDANMEEASARLQALQVQQQLGVQSLSIANQAPQSILSLFR